MRKVTVQRQFDKGPDIHECRFHPDGKLAAVEHTNWDGSHYLLEYKYADNGDLIEPSRDVKIIRNSDGSRIETERIPVQQNLCWGSIEGLEKTGGMAFPTREASQVEVSFDANGVPTEALFKFDSGEVASRIVFRSDANGEIVEILQYSGAKPLAPLPAETLDNLSDEQKQQFAPFLLAGALVSRTTYEYDQAGHLIERVTYLGNELLEHVVWSYTEHGDKATVTEHNGWPVRFEYEYDEHGNFTREVVTHGMGSDETIRTFLYYD